MDWTDDCDMSDFDNDFMARGSIAFLTHSLEYVADQSRRIQIAAKGKGSLKARKHFDDAHAIILDARESIEEERLV